jgi:hypothetical protein
MDMTANSSSLFLFSISVICRTKSALVCIWTDGLKKDGLWDCAFQIMDSHSMRHTPLRPVLKHFERNFVIIVVEKWSRWRMGRKYVLAGAIYGLERCWLSVSGLDSCMSLYIRRARVEEQMLLSFLLSRKRQLSETKILDGYLAALMPDQARATLI